jgi:hypothetical protein
MFSVLLLVLRDAAVQTTAVPFNSVARPVLQVLQQRVAF